jgi:hypothetical protein
MFPTCFTLILGIFHNVLIYMVFNYRRKTFCYYFELSRATGLEKGPGHGHGSQVLRHIQRAEVGQKEVNMLQMGLHHAA